MPEAEVGGRGRKLRAVISDRHFGPDGRMTPIVDQAEILESEVVDLTLTAIVDLKRR